MLSRPHTGAAQAQVAGHRPAPRMRILITLGRLRETGGTRSTVDLVRQWNAQGADATLFALQPSGDDEAPYASDIPTLLGTTSRGRLRYVLLAVALRLCREGRHSDVVVSGSETGVGLVVTMLCARLIRRPLVVFVRADPRRSIAEYLPRRWHPLARFAIRTADALICTSHELGRSASVFHRRTSEIHVIRNGLDADAIRSLAASSPPLFPSSGAPTVVSAGRLSHQKGFDVLLEAHAALIRNGCAHRVLVLGDGPDREELRRRAAELGVSGTFQLPGHLENPHPDIAAADVFCLPSRYEGLSRVTLEVLALGLPVIATTAVHEALEEGKLGDVVPTDAPEALAAAIARHLRDPRRLRRLAAAGPEHVRQFDWGASAARCLTVFGELTGRGRHTVAEDRHLDDHAA